MDWGSIKSFPHPILFTPYIFAVVLGIKRLMCFTSWNTFPFFSSRELNKPWKCPIQVQVHPINSASLLNIVLDEPLICLRESIVKEKRAIKRKSTSLWANRTSIKNFNDPSRTTANGITGTMKPVLSGLCLAFPPQASLFIGFHSN